MCHPPRRLACRYEPGIQRTYEDLAGHYGTTVLPARPLRPRDKAKVEVGVQVVERWILARLRNETFFSLEALNERIAELLLDLNERKMRVYGASRRELFERLDQPALKALPAEPFVYAEWKTARLNIDYHAEIDHHYYSAPYPLVHEQVEARMTATTMELFHKGERVASHVRSYLRGRPARRAVARAFDTSGCVPCPVVRADRRRSRRSGECRTRTTRGWCSRRSD